MSNVLKSKYKASRRLGASLWGDAKDPFNKKNYRPGQHGAGGTVGKLSDYGVHLRAKQRLKNHYGRVTEKQFRKDFIEAQRMKGNTGDNFVALLERRLDAIIYRMTVAPTIFSARQIVSHGHVTVNGRRVNIASFKVKVGDIVQVRDSAKTIALISNSIASKNRSVPDYISFDESSMSGFLTRVPVEADVPYPFTSEVHMVVELYSR